MQRAYRVSKAITVLVTSIVMRLARKRAPATKPRRSKTDSNRDFFTRGLPRLTRDQNFSLNVIGA